MTGSTKTVRALSRGLQVLRILNMSNGATAAEIVRHARLPRTTVLRSLETLGSEGFVQRDPVDDRYRLTILTQTLSHGFDDEAWIANLARPLLVNLARDVVWPLSLSTQSGGAMILRENTDRQSPLALQRLPGGHRFSILGSAGGRAYLAFAGPTEREALIPLLAKSTDAGEKLAQDRPALEALLTQIREAGFAAVQGALPKESAFAVPVLVEGRAIAAVTLRFITSALPLEDALERYLPRLKTVSEEIGRRFGEARSV